MSSPIFANPQTQTFSFPFHVMKHIYANATPNQWKKLNRTCKCFYAKFQNLIIDDLKISYAPMGAKGYSIVIPPEHPFFEKMENAWLTKSISLENYSTPEAYDELMLKLNKWDIEKLEVGGDLKVEIFNKLAKYGNIQHLTISSVGEEEGNLMAVEEILENVPCANRVTIHVAHVTPQTSQKLAALNYNKKITVFQLMRVHALLDVDLFFEFIKKNIAPRGTVRIDYANDPLKENTIQFRKTLKEKISAWYPQDQRPHIVKFYWLF